MDDDEAQKGKNAAALAAYQKMLDDGIPLITSTLSPPAKMYSENGSLVIEAANLNMVAVGGQAAVVRVVIPGGMAMQLRDLLNKSTFNGSEQPVAKH